MKTKHFLIYKITNLINKKIYIGQHVTYNINDNYFGSGIYLLKEIEKYGIDNFKKEIIKQCETFQQMNQLEKQLVNKDFIKEENNYNFAVGGNFGWKNVFKNMTQNQKFQHYQKISKMFWNNLNSDPIKKEEFCMKIRNSVKNNPVIQNGTFKGKKHTEQTKQKMRDKAKNRTGIKNSQYGTCWIYNLKLKLNKKIKKSQLNYWLQKDWEKGRKIIFN